MSKGTVTSKRHKGGGRDPDRPRTPDGAIYIGLLMIGSFAVLLGFLFTEGKHWREVGLGYLIAIAYLVNLYTFRAYRGTTLAGWQAALARLPLRCVGYGTRGGRPLEAAKGQENARTMLLVSIATSVVVIAGLSFWLFPR